MQVLKTHKLTAKQEKFTVLYLSGSTMSDAYRASYNVKTMQASTIHECASKLLKNHKIAARIAEAKAKVEKVVVANLTYDRLAAIRELDVAMALAVKMGAPAPMVSAVRLKCELHRLIIKQEEHGKAGEFSELTDVEVDAKLEAMRAITQAREPKKVIAG